MKSLCTNEQRVEETAYLVISKDKIGVTPSLDDVKSLLGQDPTRTESFYIVRGEKASLLEMEFKVMFHDAITSLDLGKLEAGQSFVSPELNRGYNLCTREIRDDAKWELKPLIHRFG